MAVPWSKDQPTEVWVLAKLRFYFKPRKRIWDQSGMEELVTITAPKKEEKQLTKNYSQTEVKSRLEALAQTIDSRGWAIKEHSGGAVYQPIDVASDRLVDTSILPEEVPIIDTSTIPDVYAGETATSVNFDRMIEESNELRKAQSLEKMDRIRHGEPLDTIVMPEVHFTPPSVENNTYSMPAVDEKALTEDLKNRRAPDSIATAHMRTIRPITDTKQSPPVVAQAQPNPDRHFLQDSPVPSLPAVDQPVAGVMQNDPDQGTPPQAVAQVSAQNDSTPEEPVTPPTSPAILEYAGNNDLNIATIARQAKKDTEGDDNEVVISLH